MQTNAIVLFVRFLVTDIVLDVVRFPVWWYTRGLVKAFGWYNDEVRYASDRLALLVLLKNMGRPMFGDYSKEGRLISLGVRFVQLIVSLILFVLWTLWYTLLILVYVLLLPAVLLIIAYLLPYGA